MVVIIRDTIKISFFPKEITDELSNLGYAKSKKGNWYKIYLIEQGEMLAIPNCKQLGNQKGVMWFVKQGTRPLHLEEARQLSEEFDEDVITIHELIIEWNGKL